jgi:hypothetical protein
MTLAGTTSTLVAAKLSAVMLLTGSAAGLKVSVKAPGHAPKIKIHWNYKISVTRHGKPVAAKLTEQIVDPIGGVHPVQVGPSTKNITRLPIKGTYKDYIIWPAESRGIPLTFRITIQVGRAKKIVNYKVTPH